MRASEKVCRDKVNICVWIVNACESRNVLLYSLFWRILSSRILSDRIHFFIKRETERSLWWLSRNQVNREALSCQACIGRSCEPARRTPVRLSRRAGSAPGMAPIYARHRHRPNNRVGLWSFVGSSPEREPACGCRAEGRQSRVKEQPISSHTLRGTRYTHCTS
jgi:hypothetical protein